MRRRPPCSSHGPVRSPPPSMSTGRRRSTTPSTAAEALQEGNGVHLLLGELIPQHAAAATAATRRRDDALGRDDEVEPDVVIGDGDAIPIDDLELVHGR